MAGVAKWLRRWIVASLFAGSIPVIRPIKKFVKDRRVSLKIVQINSNLDFSIVKIFF